MTERTKKEILKKEIKKHFNTFTSFAKEGGLDYYAFSRDFLNNPYPDKEYIATLHALLVRLRDSGGIGPVTASELKSLKKAISQRGGVIKFCREEFEKKDGFILSEPAVYKILAGDDSYRKAARRLIDYLLTTA